MADRPLPDKDGLATARGEVRALALRADDFRELCEDDAELGEALLDALAATLQARMKRVLPRSVVVVNDADPRGTTNPNIRIRLPSDRGAIEGTDVPVVMTDKPVVDRPAGTSQTMPGLKRISKLQEVVGPPPVAQAAAPVAAAPAAARPLVTPVMPKPRAPTPPRGVAITPPAGTPAAPPMLPPLPKLRAGTAPPVGIPTTVDDSPSASVEVDMNEGDQGEDDLPNTHVGPPPIDTIDDEAPPLELPSAPPVRPTTQPPVLELEPEAKFDIDPEDAADIEKRKRKKRLTEGWDE